MVVGGSMSGLLAGLLLRRSGWEVDIFERVESELAGRGAGIVAQPDLIETLRGLGIDPSNLGVEITTRKILDSSGQLASELTCPQVLTAWERVYRVLRDAFPPQHYHRGRGVRAFEQNDDSLAARSRRPSIDHSPTMPTGAGAALRRLRGLARAHSGGGICGRDPS